MNIYELQNKGVKVNKVGTSTPAISTPRLNIKDLPQGAVKKVAPPKEPGFIKQVLGDIYSAASTVGATVEQPLAAGAAVVGQNIGAGINKLRGVESKPIENYTDALARIRKEDESFMKQNLPSSFNYKPANTPKEFAGAVLETGANVAGGGAGSQLVKQGFRRALKPLAVEGAAIFGTQNLGSELRKGKDVVESIPGALGSAAIGAVASPLLAVGGQKAVDAAMKYGGKLSPTIARDTLPTLFKNTTEKSQENLDRVLDYIAQPNFSSPKVRDSIEYVRSQFPNLQEEVALRSGSPIKTVKEGNKVKFQTANQADVIKNKAIAESQAASKLASTFDNQYKVSKNDVINEIDSVLSQTKGIDIPTLRAEMLKKINKDFVTLTVKPSKAEVARKNANTNRKEYNDADALLGKVYKNVLAKTIPDPQYLTSLRNSADNFDLSDLLFNLHNKTAEAERGALSKVTTGVGRAIETAGRIIPANVGSPLEYLGKAIKAIPELTSSERRLASDAITNLVTRAQKVGANISDNEQRVLNFARRLEQSNKTGTPIDINIDDINALKNLDEVKKYESAVSLFNKRFGEEVLTPDDNFGIDLVKFYDRMQGASSKQKADITAELYKEILKGNKTTAKTVLPPAKPQEIKMDLSTPSKKLPTIKQAEAIDEARFYDNLASQGKSETVVPFEVMQERIDELTKKIGERRVSKEITQQAYDNLKDSFAGGGFNFKVYAQMRNAGARDIESLNKAGLGEQGAAVLRQLEDYAGDKDISEMMAQADEILDLAKQVREPVGTKDLISERKRLISDAMVEKARAVLNKSGKPTEYRTLGITTEELQAAATIGARYIEDGVRTAVELGERLAKDGIKLTKAQLDKIFIQAQSLQKGARLDMNKIDEAGQFVGMFKEGKFSSPEMARDAKKFITDNGLDYKKTLNDKETYDLLNSVVKMRKDLRQTLSIPKELQPLAEEAKKYKSAEEFVKAQSSLFRGVESRPAANRIRQGATPEYTGVAFSREKGSAQKYGDMLMNKYIPESKILKPSDVTPRTLKMLRGEFNKLPVGDADSVPTEILISRVMSQAKQQGKAGADIAKFFPKMKEEKEVRLFGNADVTYSKSQLTDMWNKANGKN